MTTFNITPYNPLPTLQLFHQSNADMRAMVGPVGSGKTSAAAWEIFYYLPFFLAQKYQIMKTRWGIIRNTYRELMDTTQKTPEGAIHMKDNSGNWNNPHHDHDELPCSKRPVPA